MLKLGHLCVMPCQTRSTVDSRMHARELSVPKFIMHCAQCTRGFTQHQAPLAIVSAFNLSVRTVASHLADERKGRHDGKTKQICEVTVYFDSWP